MVCSRAKRRQTFLTVPMCKLSVVHEKTRRAHRSLLDDKTTLREQSFTYKVSGGYTKKRRGAALKLKTC